MSAISLSETADSQRQKIQHNTFKRWVNENLKLVDKSVNDLAADFSDGIKLIALVEVLSGKKFKKCESKPKSRIHKLENITTALEFLEKEEKIKLVNIDSTAIVDSKLSLILGLIWTLILHYSFQKSKWYGEKVKTKQTDSPKQRLMKWINERSQVKITNFTVEWNSGKALGALINSISPDLLSEWESWCEKNALENVTRAMNIAEKHLNVKQLIKPIEMTNPNVDEMSVITYLSQYPKIKLKTSSSASVATTNLESISVVSRESSIVPKSSTDIAKLQSHAIGYVTGRGVQPNGLRVGDIGMFVVHINAADNKEVVAYVNVKGGNDEKAAIKQIDSSTFEVSYKIKVVGKYILSVTIGGDHVHGSPFIVNVGPKITSPVVIFGPGLQTGVSGCTSAFVIENFGNPVEIRYTVCGPVECWIGVYQDHDGTAMASFEPTSPGEYVIHFTTVDSEHLPNSPFVVDVQQKPENFDPKQVVVTGPGFKNNVYLNEPLEYQIDAKLAGVGKVELVVYDYQQKPINVTLVDNKNGTYKAKFWCCKREKHIAILTFGGVIVPKFPFEIYVYDPALINVFGPALSGEQKVGQLTEFTVDATKTDRGDMSMIVLDERKQEVPYKITGLQKRSFKVSFTPITSGVHLAYIYYADNKLPISPIIISVK